MSTLTRVSSLQLDSFYMQHSAQEYMLTRWDMVQDRLHMMMDFFCHMKCGKVSVRFLNRSDKLDFEPSPSAVASVHQWIYETFQTPTRRTNSYCFQIAQTITSHKTNISIFVYRWCTN
jgi:hypothetical protein